MIDLVPLREFSDRIKKGWKMVPGFPLEPGDYAVTMQSPDHKNLPNTVRGAMSREFAIAKSRKVCVTWRSPTEAHQMDVPVSGERS